MTVTTRSSPSLARTAVTGTAVIAVAFGFARYGFGLTVPALREEFGFSPASIGAIFSAAYGGYLAGLFGAWATSRRYGPRAPVLAGMAFAGAGSALVAAADRPWLVVVGVLVAASSSGWCWVPFSDSVPRMLAPASRDRALAVISTGTTFGLLVVGPLALIAADRPDGWRWLWAIFAAAAVAAGLANLRLLPATATKPEDGAAAGGGARPLRRPGGGRLVVFSAVYGGLAAGFYTFAVDLVAGAGLPPSWSALLWTFVGLGGITGVATGALIQHAGLRAVITGGTLVLAAATAALAVAPGAAVLVALSATIFGAAYMPLSAVLPLWNARIYPDRAVDGFAVVLLALAAGSIIAPLPLGLLARSVGLPVTFLVLAALTSAAALLRPARTTTTHPSR